VKRLVLILLIVLILAGLSLLPTETQETVPWGGVTIGEIPKPPVPREPAFFGGTLICPLPSDPVEMSPFTRATTWSFYFFYPIYDSMVGIDSESRPVPWLAEYWESTPDGIIWTIHLVKNATWHDGTPFTAHDVKFTFDHVLEVEYPRWSDLWETVEKVEVIDDYTLKIYLKFPYPDFVTDVLTFPIVPKHIWEEVVTAPDFDPFTYRATDDVLKVGNAPWIFVEYVPGQYVKYKANPNFFKGRPFADELLMPIITSPDAGILALRKGEVDEWYWRLSSEALPTLLQDPDIRIHLYLSPYVCHWGFNTQKFPLNIKEFRYALAHCVDKDYVVETIMHGYGRPGRFGVWPITGIFEDWANPDPKCGVYGYEFDLSKAAEILDELGFTDIDGDGFREGPNGEEIDLELAPPTYCPIRVRTAEMIKEWLAQIPGGGINAHVVYQEWKTLWPRIKLPPDHPDKPDTWFLCSSYGTRPSPDIMRFRLHSSKIPNPNYYGFINATFDELAEEQARTVDVEKRKEIAKKMQAILAEELPFISIFHRYSISAYRVDKWIGWEPGVMWSVNNGWSWWNCVLREKAVLKPMTITLTEYPAPRTAPGESVTTKISLTDPEGNPITGASVTMHIAGIPEVFELEEVETGVYSIVVSTEGWVEQPYTAKIVCSAPGFEEAATVLSFELTRLAAPTFWEAYGPAVVGLLVIIVVVIAAYAAYAVRRRSSTEAK